MIASMLKAGRLRPEYRGVYVVGHSAPIPLGRETAALLAAGANAVLSGESAAELWGVKRPPRQDECVEMIVIGGRRTRSRNGILAHRSDLITPQDVRHRARLPVTSPEWTLLDLAARGTQRDAERAVDELLAQRLTSVTKLEQLLARTTGQKGHSLLAGVVAHQASSTITRSEAEERMLAMIRAAGLPPPELNARVCGYEVDFYWPAQRVAVEVDGYRWHSGAMAFERDRRKGNALTAAGIDLLRVTWNQMEREALAVIAGVARTLALRTTADREQAEDQGSARPGG
jgi:very-short-patch-repair endonuclease